MASKCPAVVAQADFQPAIAVPVSLIGRTVLFIISTFPAAGQEGSLPAHPSLGVFLPSPASCKCTQQPVPAVALACVPALHSCSHPSSQLYPLTWVPGTATSSGAARNASSHS